MDTLVAVRKFFSYAKRNGLESALCAARERREDLRLPYQYEPPSEKTLSSQRMRYREIASSGEMLTFSILVPLYETPPRDLKEMIASVRSQTYENFELILADASKEPLQHLVEEAAEGDKRVHYLRLSRNNGIAENTNAALLMASGDYACLLDHDDLLTPDALYEMAREIGAHAGEEVVLLYSDEDKCEEEGKRFFEPNRKPDFNLDYLLSNNYICHFTVIRMEELKEAGFRREYDGSQDYDVILRTGAQAEMSGKGRVLHVPKVLYHWRTSRTSTAANPASKHYAYDAGRRVVMDFLSRRNIDAKVENLAHLGFYRVLYLPDVFAARRDIGVIGAKITDSRGRLLAGMYNEAGETLFSGLKKGYSGGFQHRAAVQQDAFAVSLLGIRYRAELHALYRRVCAGKKIEEMTEEELREKSLSFCKAVRKRGYRIYWDPQEVYVRAKDSGALVKESRRE